MTLSSRTKGSIGSDATLLYLVGATLPFPLIGVPLNELFVMSLTPVLGLVFGARRWMRHGWQPLHKTAAVMLLVFTASSALRHPVTSYVLSVGALALALIPLTTPELGGLGTRALLKGLMLGLWATLALTLATILLQISGLQGLLGPFAPLLVGTEQTGMFLGYVRPFAGFSEPSHLAIYFATMYVALDLLARAGTPSGLTRPCLAVAIVFTGSVSGLVLFVTYLVADGLIRLRRLLRKSLAAATMLRTLVAVLALLVVVSLVGPNSAELVDEYAVRVVQTLDDIETGNLVGSEGSRINAVLALPDYWESAGLSGFLMGTGYANYQSWLIDNYGHLDESATFSRGGIDNILIAVFLSTGVLGFIAYLAFLYKAFGPRAVAANPSLVVFVLALNFSYGYLISGLYWDLLFVLAAMARLNSSTPVRDPGRMPSVRRQSQTAASA